MPGRDVLVRATKDQILDFKESMLWKDFKAELAMWKKQFQSEYGELAYNCLQGKENTASALTHLGDLHGRGMAVDYMLRLPDIFLSVLEDREAKAE